MATQNNLLAQFPKLKRLAYRSRQVHNRAQELLGGQLPTTCNDIVRIKARFADDLAGVLDASIPNACVALGFSAVGADLDQSSWRELGQQLPQALAEDLAMDDAPLQAKINARYFFVTISVRLGRQALEGALGYLAEANFALKSAA